MQWDKQEDKFAIVGLGVSGIVALWASAGLLSVSILMIRLTSLHSYGKPNLSAELAVVAQIMSPN
jgi:hypothetical protein